MRVRATSGALSVRALAREHSWSSAEERGDARDTAGFVFDDPTWLRT